MKEGNGWWTFSNKYALATRLLVRSLATKEAFDTFIKILNDCGTYKRDESIDYRFDETSMGKKLFIVLTVVHIPTRDLHL